MNMYNTNIIRNIMGDDSLEINPKFNNVERLNDSIKKGIQQCCLKFGVKYPNSFDDVINEMEKAILASKNWFNAENLNFQTIKDCLKINYYTKEKNFLDTFKLLYSEKGSKNNIRYDVNELIAVGQGEKFQNNLTSLTKWLYLKSFRIKNINIIDNSDAYKSKCIDFEAIGKDIIIKKNKVDKAMLVAYHTHSYSIVEKDYSCILEKFNLSLIFL